MKSLVPTTSTQRTFKGARALAYAKPKAGSAVRATSTISIKSSMWAEMLTLCHDSTTAAYAFIKSASSLADPSGHKSWSECVRVAALFKMRGSYKPSEFKGNQGTNAASRFDGSAVAPAGAAHAGDLDADAVLAADNNAAWADEPAVFNVENVGGAA